MKCKNCMKCKDCKNCENSQDDGFKWCETSKTCKKIVE